MSHIIWCIHQIVHLRLRNHCRLIHNWCLLPLWDLLLDYLLDYWLLIHYWISICIYRHSWFSSVHWFINVYRLWSQIRCDSSHTSCMIIQFIQCTCYRFFWLAKWLWNDFRGFNSIIHVLSMISYNINLIICTFFGDFQLILCEFNSVNASKFCNII